MNMKKKIIVIILVIVLLIVLVAGITENSKIKWQAALINIPIPEHVSVVLSGFFADSGSPMGGNDDSYTYVYYWIVESDLQEELLSNYYSESLDKINSQFGGYGTYVHVMPLFSYNGVNLELRGIIEKASEEKDLSKERYLILAIKPGRSFLIN